MNKVTAKIAKFPISKTVWFNVLSAVVAVADQLAGTNMIPLPWFASAVAVGNIILRCMTGKPIETLGKAKPVIEK